MKSTELNEKLRRFVKNRLSPTSTERKLITEIYASLKNTLGVNSCLQIGSYPRYTAITPVHDLDVLYLMGAWVPNADPSKTLAELRRTLEGGFENPTRYDLKISPQTHSITLQFLDGDRDVLSVDVVPAYSKGRNEFGDDMYMVPELLNRNHGERQRLYRDIASGSKVMTWIPSDPRGYISVASAINERNEDFRKSVKFPKAWKAAFKKHDDSFALKSFHLEQIITGYFRQSAGLEISDAILRFFRELPSWLERSQIPDRADPYRHIDDYVNRLTHQEKAAIIAARDVFLRKVDALSDGNDVEELLQPDRSESQVRVSVVTGTTGRPAGQDRGRRGEFAPRAPWCTDYAERRR